MKFVAEGFLVPFDFLFEVFEMGRFDGQRQIAILTPVTLYAFFVDEFFDQFKGIQ